MDKIEKLQSIIDNSNNIVFFGGAGVSTASGIPDFRGINGLYRKKYKHNPEVILSHQFFMQHVSLFYEFYFDKMIHKDALPNECHKKLKELEDKSKLKAIITQNIDGLHEKAGSKNVLELHGTIYKNHCMMCKKEYNLIYMLNHKPIPTCECNGIIKPNVVLYEEELDENTIKKAISYIKKADVLIVGGTSLNVQPAASFIKFYKGDKLILINKEKTNLDYLAHLIINDDINEVFKKIVV